MLSKGKKVYVEGRLQTNSWEAADGSKRSRTEIVAESFIPLSPKDGMGGFDVAEAITATSTDETPKKKKTSEPTPTDEINLDDIPF
jgi:single-strand DNA-binding protein